MVHGSLRILLALLAGASFAGQAQAHHSYAMFDRNRIATIEGTVAKVDWNNPHVWFWFYGANGKGGYDLYGMESGGVGGLARVGWTRDTFKVGDKVKVDYQPLRDGRRGGYFVRATRPNGQILLGDQAAFHQLPGETAAPPTFKLNQ